MTENHRLRTDPELALETLIEGNRRYASNQTVHPDRGAERRAALSEKQEPFATIVGCADSRVPAEFVFDRGLGDLFVVRTAGHIVDEVVLATIEFGAIELGIPLIFVLGHEGCGAVKAALNANEGAEVSDHAQPLIKAIMPAIRKTKSLSGDPVGNAVRANIELTLDRLKLSESLAPDLRNGKIKIVGGLYDLDTGVVEVTVTDSN
jgi:carbonic anhydrase